MNASLKKQDMPPAGGYAPIIFKRIPAKKHFNGFTIFGIYLSASAIGLWLYSLNYFERRREDIEMRSSRFALLPMLLAERDREILRQMRKNRDAETELMKNVEGWEVGTLNGEPVYKTMGDDFFFEPTDSQFYVHAGKKEWHRRFFIHQYL